MEKSLSHKEQLKDFEKKKKSAFDIGSRKKIAIGITGRKLEQKIQTSNLSKENRK
jgi:hypothetical protein